MEENDISQINLVIVNLYPFEKKLLEDNPLFEEMIENIDIGGPSMLRSASKNFKYVTVIPAPKYYNEFLDELLVKEKLMDIDSSIYDMENVSLVHHVNQALKAHKIFNKDTDYLVKDNQVISLMRYYELIKELKDVTSVK